VDSTTDVIIEAGSEGLDTVESSVTYSLQALTNVERLTLVGIASTRATGNTRQRVFKKPAASKKRVMMLATEVAASHGTTVKNIIDGKIGMLKSEIATPLAVSLT
jgi:hypothetical protein